MRCGLGIGGGGMQPRDESCAQVAADDHEGSYAAQTLEDSVLAAVTQR